VRSLAILLLALGTGCSHKDTRAAQPPATAQPAHPPASKPADASREAGELAGVFGIGSTRAVPEGLVPGGDCPPGGATATQEIAAQSAAPIPLQPGLTFAYVWTPRPQEEYECLIQVQKVDADGIDVTASCNYPQRPGPFTRRICRSDLRSARMLHTEFGQLKVIGPDGKELPETIVGATAFSLSSAEFAELKRTGSVAHHYVELASSGQLAKDGVGTLRLEATDKLRVVVNDRPIEVPVIHASGEAHWWIQGQAVDTRETVVVVDDERFPVIIDTASTAEAAASRIQFAKISYPNPQSSDLERQLVEKQRVDVYGIYFDFASDKIRTESQPILQEIADVLTRHPDWRLSVEGHTDNIGSDSANMDLSQRRTEAVRAVLVSRFGVSADRLVASGHGASAPRDTNDTPEGRAHNRRVELVRR